MPYASKAQARAMHAKANRGEISQKTVHEFDESTNFKKLPEKKHMKPKMNHGDTDVEVDHKSAKVQGTDGGKDGSHDKSHKELGGARAKIMTGHPDELEAYHKGGK